MGERLSDQNSQPIRNEFFLAHCFFTEDGVQSCSANPEEHKAHNINYFPGALFAEVNRENRITQNRNGAIHQKPKSRPEAR
jgi:hypothetical protein